MGDPGAIMVLNFTLIRPATFEHDAPNEESFLPLGPERVRVRESETPRMAVEVRRVDSLSNFIETVSRIRDQWYEENREEYFDPWFRGQRIAGWDLVPSYYRRDLAPQHEDSMRGEFIRRGTQLHGSVPATDAWAWYFLQQHYRCPTRLLDWSDGSLIALFFAVNSNEPHQVRPTANAAVWMLDPWRLNQLSIGNDSVVDPNWDEAQAYLPELFMNRRRAPRLPLYPMAIDPPHIDPRLAAQRSRFTIHGREHHGLERIAKKKPKARLMKIEIVRRSIDRIRLELATCGITDSVLFPDLEGLSLELERYDQADMPDDDQLTRIRADVRRARARRRTPRSAKRRKRPRAAR